MHLFLLLSLNLIVTDFGKLILFLFKAMLTYFQSISILSQILFLFYIRVNNPTLNNNIGKFNLSHIWDRILLNTKGLTLNKQGNNNNNQTN